MLPGLLDMPCHRGGGCLCPACWPEDVHAEHAHRLTPCWTAVMKHPNLALGQDQDFYDKLPEACDDEEDMLDLAFGLTETCVPSVVS